MKTVLNDLESDILTEAVNMAQNRPLEVPGCEWHYALIAVQGRNDDDDDIGIRM